jgi:predicted  nucleic acid-binding Zn-ribbon protein
MPDAPEKPTAAHQDDILLLAEKLGEALDRLNKIEGELTAQTAPLDAAGATIGAAHTALTAALKGIEQLNFHVLDNNLGAVSKRVETVAQQATQAIEAHDKKLAEYQRSLTALSADTTKKLSEVDARRTELAKKRDADTTEFAQHVAGLKQEIEWARETFTSELAKTRREFADPKTFNPRGKWDPMQKYARLDLAELNGSTYISSADDNDEKPDRKSKAWQLLARRGGGAALGGGATDITGVAGMGATGLQLAQAAEPVDARDILGVDDFVGASSGADGEAGRVPQPVAGDQNKYLRADGTWTTPSTVTAPAASQSTVDAGTQDAEYVSPLTLHGYVDQRFLNRASRPQIISDGATPARGQFIPGNTRNNLAGAPVLTVAAMVYFPPASSTAGIYAGSSTVSASPLSTAWASGLAWSGNDLVIFANGATPATDFRKYTISGIRTTYAGQYHFIEAYLVNGSTDPVFKLDGVTVSGTASDGAGTDPDWLSPSSVWSWHVTGYLADAGPAPIVYPINAALSAADRAYWLLTGQPPAWVARGGHVGPFTPLSAYAFNLTSPTGFAGTTSSWSATSTSGGGSPWRVQAGSIGLVITGQSIRVSFTMTGAVGGETFGFRDGISTQITATVAPVNGANTFTIPFTASSNAALPTFTGTGLSSLAYSSITITQLSGALSLPAVGPDRVVRDATRIAPANHGYMVGMAPVTTEQRGVIPFRRTNSGWLFFDGQIVGDGRGIQGISATGNGTFSIGDSAGGSAATVLSSATGTASIIPFTPLKALTTSGKIYMTLGTATDVSIWVFTEPFTALT